MKVSADAAAAVNHKGRDGMAKCNVFAGRSCLVRHPAIGREQAHVCVSGLMRSSGT